MFYRILFLSLAGAAGTLARYGLSGLTHHYLGWNLPWGTAAVNTLGCLLFGVIWALAEERLAISAETRLIILVGFLGAFTTFSSLVFETNHLLRDMQWLAAGLNLVGGTILGFAALWLGLLIGRSL